MELLNMNLMLYILSVTSPDDPLFFYSDEHLEGPLSANHRRSV